MDRSKSHISSAPKGRGSHQCVDHWEPLRHVSATLGNKIKIHDVTKSTFRSKEVILTEIHNLSESIQMENKPDEGVVFS